MRKLTCFVLAPSNRVKGQGGRLLLDERWGLVETPTGCKEAVDSDPGLNLNFDEIYEYIIEEAIKQINTEYKDQQIEIECIRSQDLQESG